MISIRWTVLGVGLAGVMALGQSSDGADWPQWGGQDGRNMAAFEEGLPAWFDPGKKRPDGSGIDLGTTKNVKWVVQLGSENYSSPVISAGRVLIGTNDEGLDDPRFKPTGGGVLLCLDEATGRLLWRFVSPKMGMEGKASADYDKMTLGICSTAAVDGDRVYVVTNRCEVVCLDLKGMADGNSGPFTDEAHYGLDPGHSPLAVEPTDADVIWRFDMLSELPVYPHDAADSSPIVVGDLVYVGTGNGINGTEGLPNINPNAAPYPHAPSLIALDKRTGRLAAKDGAEIGTRVFHGQWSSPSSGRVGDKTLIFYGGGDGVCYAFEALSSVPEKPVTLKTVWSCDCNPEQYKLRDGKPIDYWDGDNRLNPQNKNDGTYYSPSEIIATPVFHGNRVYVATGQDPMHGRARGMLHCIDATKTGDLTKTGKIWSYEMERSLSTVSIADGLLYIADYPGRIHCLSADTGQPYWIHDLAAFTWSSTFVADGKVYHGTRKNFTVLSAGKEPHVLGEIRLGSQVRSTPVAANGVLYVASQRYLWAVKANPGETGPTAAPRGSLHPAP